MSYEEVVFSWEAYAVELLEDQAVATSAADTSTCTSSMRRKRAPIKFDRVLEVLEGLGTRIKPQMQPHEVYKMVHPAYRTRWSGEVVDDRTVLRAYEAHMADTTK